MLLIILNAQGTMYIFKEVLLCKNIDVTYICAVLNYFKIVLKEYLNLFMVDFQFTVSFDLFSVLLWRILWTTRHATEAIIQVG